MAHIELHHNYRSLDYLSRYNKLIQRELFQTGRNLFNIELDIFFYDVTTFYFSIEVEDGFREKGFSKDGKIGKTLAIISPHVRNTSRISNDDNERRSDNNAYRHANRINPVYGCILRLALGYWNSTSS